MTSLRPLCSTNCSAFQSPPSFLDNPKPGTLAAALRHLDRGDSNPLEVLIEREYASLFEGLRYRSASKNEAQEFKRKIAQVLTNNELIKERLQQVRKDCDDFMSRVIRQDSSPEFKMELTILATHSFLAYETDRHNAALVDVSPFSQDFLTFQKNSKQILSDLDEELQKQREFLKNFSPSLFSKIYGEILKVTDTQRGRVFFTKKMEGQLDYYQFHLIYGPNYEVCSSQPFIFTTPPKEINIKEYGRSVLIQTGDSKREGYGGIISSNLKYTAAFIPDDQDVYRSVLFSGASQRSEKVWTGFLVQDGVSYASSSAEPKLHWFSDSTSARHAAYRSLSGVKFFSGGSSSKSRLTVHFKNGNVRTGTFPKVFKLS